MARATKTDRILTCQKTGKTFVYSGVGRPPKYHPDVQNEVRAGQRKASAAKRAKTTKRAA
jgi:hypothetical protein